jgi:hypothetical protein
MRSTFSYDVISEPIALVATERGRLILAKILMRANDLKELIAWLRANPRQGFAGKHRPRGFTHSGFSWPSGCGIEDIITRPDLADRAILLQWLPRMADFALWVAACETGFHPEDAFEAAYRRHRKCCGAQPRLWVPKRAFARLCRYRR